MAKPLTSKEKRNFDTHKYFTDNNTYGARHNPLQQQLKMHLFTALLTGLIATVFLPQAANANQQKTPMNTGFIGLNTIPSARMNNAGTITAGISNLDPFLHAYIGLQIADPLFVNIRQTAEISNINENAKHLYPGVDLKLRLRKETEKQPEVSIGMQSAFGHKRMAGEFIALSKRHNNVDITLGVGWGRYGTAAHFKNPLKAISSHFENPRKYNSPHPNTPQHWFTGEHIGLFGGIEYTLPVKGLSVKLDYGADRYTAEKSSFAFNAPAPWSAGLSYSPYHWLNAGLAIQGTDKIMSRLSLQSSPEKWPIKGHKYNAPKPFYKARSHHKPNITKITQDAAQHNIELSNIHYSKQSVFAEVEIPQGTNTPKHIGRAIRILSDHSDATTEEIIITPTRNSLRGSTVKIMRKDVENALDNHQGSPEEIWKNTEFQVTTKEKRETTRFLHRLGINKKTTYNITLENQLSLSEEDNGILYRSGLITSAQTSPFLGFLTGAAMRINLHDNLDNLEKLRPASPTPVKSDINTFTNERISLENAHLTYARSLSPTLHTSISAGYLEEFYTGLGGQTLYRPFKSRLALGAEIWQVARREPNTMLNMGLSAGSITTGHINAWYDIPHHDITIKSSIGRFLGTDIGLGIGLEKKFKNGATLQADFAISNHADHDIFGGTTHANHSLSLNLPLGAFPITPSGSTATTKVAPFGRNIAQRINKPFDLYKETEGFTLNHTATHWTEILD